MSTDPLQSVRDAREEVLQELAAAESEITQHLADIAHIRGQRDTFREQLAALDRALAPKRTRRTNSDPATGTFDPDLRSDPNE